MAEKKRSKTEKVVVHVRLRPFGQEEQQRHGTETSIDMFDIGKRVITVKKDFDRKTYVFDSLFNQQSRQSDVFERVASPVVTSIIQGYNGTIFAYGQTGTGKTHTMIGDTSDQANWGIIPRCCQALYDHISSDPESSYTIQIGFLQLYMEMLQDLLYPDSNRPIRIREDPDEGVYLSGINWVGCSNVSQCMKLLAQGDRNRNTSFTKMNATSSRSHAVYMIKMEKRRKYTPEALEELSRQGSIPDSGLTKSTLYLTDLAGSERVKKSKAVGNRLDEAKNINLALLALGNCIHALSERKKTKYIPFRDSKLTRLLEDSLGGNCKTSLVITIGPAAYHTGETISTLQFGSRAMKIENRPEINKQIDYRALCAQLQAELDRVNDDKGHNYFDNSGLLAEIEQLRQQVEQLTIENAELKAQLEQTNAGNEVNFQEDIKKVRKYYEAKIKRQEDEHRKFLDEIDRQMLESENEFNDLRNENQEFKVKNANLEKQNTRLSSEIEVERQDREQSSAQFNAEMDELRQNLEKSQAKRELKFKKLLVEQKRMLATKQKELDAFTASEETYKKQIEEHSQEIQQHMKSLVWHQETISQKTQELEKSNVAQQLAKEESSEFSDLIGKLQEKVNKLRQENQSKDSEIGILNDQITDLDTQFSTSSETSQSQITEQQTKLQKSAKLIKQYVDKLDKAEIQHKAEIKAMQEQNIADATSHNEIIANLEKQIEKALVEHSNEIKSLNEQIADLKEAEKLSSTELKSIKEDISIKKTEIERMNSKLSRLKNERSDLNSKCLTLETYLVEANTTIASLKTDVESRQVEFNQELMAKNSAHIVELEAQKSKYQSKVKVLKRDSEVQKTSASNEIQETRGKIEELQEAVDYLKLENANLVKETEEKVQDMEVRVQNLNTQLKSQSEGLETSSSELSTAQSEISRLTTSLSTAQTTAQQMESRYKQDLDKANRDLEKAHGHVEAKTEEIAAVRVELDDLQRAIDSTKLQNTDLISQLSSKKLHWSKIELQITELQAEVQSKENKLSEMKLRHADTSKKLAEEFNEKGQSFEKFEADLREQLQEEQQKRADELKVKNKEIVKLQRDMSNISSENSNFAEQLEQIRAESAQKDTKLHALDSTIDSLRVNTKTLEETNSKLLDEMKSRAESLGSEAERYQGLLEEHESLRAQYTKETSRLNSELNWSVSDLTLNNLVLTVELSALKSAHKETSYKWDQLSNEINTITNEVKTQDDYYDYADSEDFEPTRHINRFLNLQGSYNDSFEILKILPKLVKRLPCKVHLFANALNKRYLSDVSQKDYRIEKICEEIEKEIAGDTDAASSRSSVSMKQMQLKQREDMRKKIQIAGSIGKNAIQGTLEQTLTTLELKHAVEVGQSDLKGILRTRKDYLASYFKLRNLNKLVVQDINEATDRTLIEPQINTNSITNFREFKDFTMRKQEESKMQIGLINSLTGMLAALSGVYGYVLQKCVHLEWLSQDRADMITSLVYVINHQEQQLEGERNRAANLENDLEGKVSTLMSLQDSAADHTAKDFAARRIQRFIKRKIESARAKAMARTEIDRISSQKKLTQEMLETSAKTGKMLLNSQFKSVCSLFEQLAGQFDQKRGILDFK